MPNSEFSLLIQLWITYLFQGKVEGDNLIGRGGGVEGGKGRKGGGKGGRKRKNTVQNEVFLLFKQFR